MPMAMVGAMQLLMAATLAKTDISSGRRGDEGT